MKKSHYIINFKKELCIECHSEVTKNPCFVETIKKLTFTMILFFKNTFFCFYSKNVDPSLLQDDILAYDSGLILKLNRK